MRIFQRAYHLFGKMKLVYRLLLLFALALVVIVVAIGIMYSVSIRMMTTETSRFTAQITDQLKISMEHALSTINNQLFNSYNLRMLIGENIEAVSSPTLTSQKYLQAKLRMDSALNEFIYTQQWIRWAAIVDINDNVYTGVRPGNRMVYDVATHMEEDKESAKAAHGGTIWRHCEDGTVLIKRMLYNWSSMKYTGYILVNLDSRLFDAALKDISHLNNGSIAVLDGDNQSLFCMPPDTQDVAAAYATAMHALEEDTFLYEESWYMVFPRKISKGGLTLLNIVDVSPFTEAMRRFSGQFILYSAICLCLILLITLVTIQPIGRNIKKMTRGIDAIASGEFDTRISLKGGGEFVQIADNINTMARRISDLLQRLVGEENLRQQANYQLLESQYHALQAQINPHFMFNALESINGIAKLNGDHATSDLVCRLSRLLRANLERTDTFSPLCDEIKHILDYLAFFQGIYPGKMTVNNLLGSEFDRLPVPTFFLQPIVENAVVHGIGCKIGPGTIMLSSRAEGDVLVISVSDDGPGIPLEKLSGLLSSDQDTPSKKRVGLRNVNERVRMLYGERFGLSVSSEEGAGTRVDIRVPTEYPQQRGDAHVFGGNH